MQAQADAGTLPEPLALLPEIGARCSSSGRPSAARSSWARPEQEVVAAPGRRLDPRAARRPAGRRRGTRRSRCSPAGARRRSCSTAASALLRTLPPARPEDVDRLRLLAPALGVDWPADAGPARSIAGLDPSRPGHAAFLEEAATLLRGAAYTPFDGAPPEQPLHSGVAAPYAHVTAPLRRLVDRFGTEVCLALCRRHASPRPSCGRRCPSCPA